VIRLLVALICLAADGPVPAGVTVPFAWTPGQIEVAVTVNGTPATFLLDTGSEYSIVSTRLTRQLGFAIHPGGAASFADGVTLGVGPLTMTDQHVMVMPFDTYYARGRQIDGLLGFDVFDRFAVKIDWTGKALTFWDRDAFTPPHAAIEVPIEFAGRLPVVSGTLQLTAGRRLPVRLMVGTGASQSIMLRHPFSTKHELFALAQGERTAPSLASGTRRLAEIPADELTIGAWTFERPQLLAFIEAIGSAGDTETDGLIGNTLLSRFTLYVDYANRRLYFEPLRR
jgi:predicted aspartyl protease